MAKGSQKRNIRMRTKSGETIEIEERLIDRIEIPNLRIRRTGKNQRLVLDLHEDDMDQAVEKELRKKGLL